MGRRGGRAIRSVVVADPAHVQPGAIRRARLVPLTGSWQDAAMIEFAASLHPLAWVAIAAVLVALASLPRALREMWVRPWKDRPAAERKDEG